ncbi:MAG: VWA domain-containing protein, partial [Proteobacteria bacterium]|nr:VWA domain-containing protein [Pseudomonadota bacterium]
MPEGISEYWRKNTSNIEAVELANLLRALRKVAGLHGSNVGLIEYTGMSQGGAANIVIEPALVTGRYPVPPEKTDLLVGLVTHEALHRVEWSDYVWKVLEPAFTEMSGLGRVGFQKMINTGENIYIDAIADQRIFGLYVQKTRNEAMAAAEAKIRTEELSIDRLILLWWAIAGNFGPGVELESPYYGPLAELARLTEELRIIGRNPKGASARCRQRAELYLSTWQTIEKRILDWKVI